VVVGSRTQPVEEVIRDGQNGFLVDMFSPEEIACRVVEVLTDRSAYAVIGLNARKTIVEHYDLQTIYLPAQLRLVKMAARGMM
jgi:glycosyltransferase involved in cell wall biosynthesis